MNNDNLTEKFLLITFSNDTFFYNWKIGFEKTFHIIKNIIANNSEYISFMNLDVMTNHDNLNDILILLGFFSSKTNIRKNRPDLLDKTIIPGEKVKIGKINLFFNRVDLLIENEY